MVRDMSTLAALIAQARLDLIDAIGVFQDRTGMPDSTFGRLAMGDPTFLYLLRKGREPAPETIDALHDFMRNYKPKKQRPRPTRGNASAAAA